MAAKWSRTHSRMANRNGLTPSYRRALLHLCAASSGLIRTGAYFARPGDILTQRIPQGLARGLYRLGFATFEVATNEVRLLITGRGRKVAAEVGRHSARPLDAAPSTYPRDHTA